jgi:hypothetical protein
MNVDPAEQVPTPKKLSLKYVINPGMKTKAQLISTRKKGFLVDNDNSYIATLAAYPGPENIRINKRE